MISSVKACGAAACPSQKGLEDYMLIKQGHELTSHEGEQVVKTQEVFKSLWAGKSSHFCVVHTEILPRQLCHWGQDRGHFCTVYTIRA